VVHTVQEGQTLWDIGAVYGVTLDDLRYMNNLQPGAVVHPGDRITVRLAEGQAPPPTPTPQLEHIVQEGQTLWDIAAIHGLTLDELLTLNGMQRGVVVFPGDKILLRTPDPTATPTPVPTATFTPSPEPPTSTPTDVPPPTLSPTVTLRPTTTLIPTVVLDGVAIVPTVSAAPPLTAPPTDSPTLTATVTASATATTVPAAHATVRRKSDNAVLLTAIMLIAGLGAVMIGGSAAMMFRRKAV
ncbi:MAG: LysM peptidoglycan-binding domain-containing protein, partial [Chloroflexi bacterium]|nr:LysM peptidoglycan-binding domain-containing protein [Chloroflexota bacterium]